MNCNCSNEYCHSKVPAEALIPIVDKCGEYRVRIVEVTDRRVKAVKLISWDEWLGLCDELRFTPDGRQWEPYVRAT